MKLVLLVLTLLVVGCTPAVVPPEPKVPPAKVASCEATCERLRDMDCDLGEPTNAGKTCENLCESMEANGVSFVSCTRQAKTCQAANDC